MSKIYFFLIILSAFFLAPCLSSKNAQIEEMIKVFVEENEPGHAIFQLAESYKTAGDFPAAIYWYKLRLEKKPNDELETWFCKWMLGQCYERIQEKESAIYWYLEAQNQKPYRPEPLWGLARMYRLEGKNDLSRFFSKWGLEVLSSFNETLFYREFQPYYFDLELSITAYYTKYREEGQRALNRLLLNKNVPIEDKLSIQRNLLFYAFPIEKVEDRIIEVKMPLISPLSSETYHPMNPSISKNNEGYTVILRAVNYTQKDALEFFTQEEGGFFCTKNFLLKLDRNFSLIEQKEILPPEFITNSLSRVKGLEDCRIVTDEQNLWFSCSTSQTNYLGIPEISLCELNPSTAKVESILPLKAFEKNRCEKNWLPFFSAEDLLFIYSFDPFIILQPDYETGNCCIHKKTLPPYDLRMQRGSAGPIPFENGYLVMSHEVVFVERNARKYLHRFLYFTKNYEIKKISDPFYFSHLGVEFCCSMTLSHDEKNLVIPYGYEDTEAHICLVSVKTVKHLLNFDKN